MKKMISDEDYKKYEFIRKYFTDFRYLSSSKEPDIYREFVRYDEVVCLLKHMDI